MTTANVYISAYQPTNAMIIAALFTGLISHLITV